MDDGLFSMLLTQENYRNTFYLPAGLIAFMLSQRKLRTCLLDTIKTITSPNYNAFGSQEDVQSTFDVIVDVLFDYGFTPSK